MVSVARIDALLRVETVLGKLRAVADGRNSGEEWCDVYLDNARTADISEKQFRACLASLSVRGQYKVIDGYAWGRVKMID